jgi:hypothetical protein
MANRRTRRSGVALLAWLVLLAVAVPSWAQTPTLGEIAKKEQERRKGSKPPAKVYTNDDLKNGGLSAPETGEATRSATDGSQSATTKGQPGDQKTTGAGAKAGAVVPATRGEDFWRGRITQARDDLHRNEVFGEALQSRINALTTDFAARDNPVERAQIADERQKALAELERVKAEVEKSKKQIADIEEEARQAGVPPGWLR